MTGNIAAPVGLIGQLWPTNSDIAGSSPRASGAILWCRHCPDTADLIGFIWVALPVGWVVLTSLRAQPNRLAPVYWPRSVSLGKLHGSRDADSTLLRYSLNSLFISLMNIIGCDAFLYGGGLFLCPPALSRPQFLVHGDASINPD